MTKETILLKKLTDKQLLRELTFRVNNKAAINTLIAQKKRERLQCELEDLESRIDELDNLISDIECV